MKLTFEWMSQLRLAAGQARQSLDCAEGTCLTGALEQVLEQLPAERSLALRTLLMDADGLASTLLVAVDGVHIPCTSDPTLTDGATILLSSPIAGG